MRVLVLGSEGFVGRNVVNALQENHDVYRAVMTGAGEKSVTIDLEDKGSIGKALSSISPEAVVNCAGVVDVKAGVERNLLFTKNLLESIAEGAVDVQKVIVCGSAGEYGTVDPTELPISETAELSSESEYGKSKIAEVQFAKEFAVEHSLNVVEARIFNPIGPGMHSRFLLTNLIQQASEIKAGERNSIEVGRLDAERDYIDIRDVARAILMIVETRTSYNEYNVGSGKKTTNRELIKRVLHYAGVDDTVTLRETSTQPEPNVASQADIARIKSDIGWEPRIDIDTTIKDVMKETTW